MSFKCVLFQVFFSLLERSPASQSMRAQGQKNKFKNRK
jgi:hypothetical protein